jgi:hypothetical protein
VAVAAGVWPAGDDAELEPVPALADGGGVRVDLPAAPPMTNPAV